MSIKILAIGDLANNFVILRKYVAKSEIHIINFPWGTASKLTDSRDVEFFDSLKTKEQIDKINSIKNNFDLAIVNTWTGAALAYITGLDYIMYFVGSALRVPPFNKNPKLDYLTKPLPSRNTFERGFYRKVLENAVFCVANAHDLFSILKKCKINKNDFQKKIKDQKIKDKLKKLTQEAFEKDIFGAPTFVVNKKIFWGQDRLDYALDEAKKN